MPSLSEFDLIKRYFVGLVPQASIDGPDIVTLGIGDDCAVVQVPAGMSLCLSLDTMVEGVHFPRNISPDKLAYRAMAAAMSDLAAMGAKPSHFTLSLTTPEVDDNWLSSFSSGLKVLAERYQFPLVGGDTTRGPLAIAIQVHGLISGADVLTRAGAQVGDVLAVTGSLGDAGAALSLLEKDGLSQEEMYLLDRYYHPAPRIEAGVELASIASACIDISDGLLADASHIAERSSVLLEIDQSLVPLSTSLQSVEGARAIDFAMTAGDDYELLFSLSEESWRKLSASDLGVNVTRIGSVKLGQGVVVKENGQLVSREKKGYKHFE